MKTRKWIVWDYKSNVIRCDYCGETVETSLIFGKPLKFAIKILESFTACHKNCKKEE